MFLAIGAWAFAGVSPSLAADLVGTNGNDLFSFEGAVQQLTTTIVNPYSGTSINIDDQFNVNTRPYDGLAGIDTLLMTNTGDAIFIENHVTGANMVANLEVFFAGDGGDIIHLASTNFTLPNVTVDGGGDNDIIWANIGNDLLNGRGGDDTIDGGPGDDTINGDPGNDILAGGEGTNIINGGLGDDTIEVLCDGSEFDDQIDGGGDFDQIDLSCAPQSAFVVVASAVSGFEFDVFLANPGEKLFSSRAVELLVFSDGVLDLTAPLVPELACSGFTAPFDRALSLRRKTKKTIPAKITLEDADAYVITDFDIAAPPAINVEFMGVIFGDGMDDEASLESVGASNDGNAFSFNPDTQQWEYRIGTKQFATPGAYTVSVRSGDETEYTIAAAGGNCTNIFTRQE